MSFLSSILCCLGSDVEDDGQVRTRRSESSKRITPSQSQIAKSLSASMSERHNNSSVQLQAGHQQQQQRQTPAKAGRTAPTGHNSHHQHQSKPSTSETTAAKDSSDSSKDTQSIIVHDEITINDTTTDHRYNTASTFNDESTGNVADNEQEDDYDLQETEQNSISSTSSSEAYERGEELDLTHFQPGQSFTSTGWLLEAPRADLAHRKCLVLDLDETLVHSSFKYVRQADFVLPVEIEGQVHNVYVIKRPGVDEFLRKVSQWYEVVVFTASVSRYGDPLLDILDKEKTIHHRLFRDSCYNYQGNYIKNLSQIGRDLKNVIIIDNSPASYIFHPQHAVPISSWFSDTHDCELLDILPLLSDLSGIDDIRLSLDINI